LEAALPTITIQMFVGRTANQKINLVKAVTDAVTTALDTAPDLVRITLVEVQKQNVARGGLLASELSSEGS
jgi:4-oxalocrotonate tautomerase